MTSTSVSRHKGGPINGPLKPHDTIVPCYLRGSRWALNWAPWFPRDTSCTSDRCFSSSLEARQTPLITKNRIKRTINHSNISWTLLFLYLLIMQSLRTYSLTDMSKILTSSDRNWSAWKLHKLRIKNVKTFGVCFKFLIIIDFAIF